MRTFQIETEVSINPYDVLEEIDTDELLNYLRDERKITELGKDPEIPTIENLTFFYFHGDLDLKKFFKSIGVENVEAALREML